MWQVDARRASRGVCTPNSKKPSRLRVNCGMVAATGCHERAAHSLCLFLCVVESPWIVQSSRWSHATSERTYSDSLAFISASRPGRSFYHSDKTWTWTQSSVYSNKLNCLIEGSTFNTFNAQCTFKFVKRLLLKPFKLQFFYSFPWLL